MGALYGASVPIPPRRAGVEGSRMSAARTIVPDLYAGMNKTEKARAIELEAMKRTGLILAWYYEKITIKLADDTRYTPDFFVVENDGACRFEETKGFWRDDAKVKLKVAAAQVPFRFFAFEGKPTQWTITEYTQPHLSTPLAPETR
jgi:hypothetical protein